MAMRDGIGYDTIRKDEDSFEVFVALRKSVFFVVLVRHLESAVSFYL